MPVEIKEISSRRELRRFVCFPFRLYRNDPHWIPPMIRGEMETLDPGKNPAFEHCETRFLMALKEGRPVGRIGGIINHRYNEQWGKKVARFSWFDLEDDEEASRPGSPSERSVAQLSDAAVESLLEEGYPAATREAGEDAAPDAEPSGEESAPPAEQVARR